MTSNLLLKDIAIYMTFVYGDPVIKNRDVVWERLTQMSLNRSQAWFMIGDFNEITGNHEKRGGRKTLSSLSVPCWITAG